MSVVLVTGASGFIGRGALEPLCADGHEVHAVSSRAMLPASGSSIQWHRADLHSEPETHFLLERVAPSHLLHLAWYAEPGAFWRSPENLRWVQASLRLLRVFAESGGRRAVLAGSCAEYQWEPRTVCVEGETPCSPATLYGASKHALRLIAESYAETVGMSLAWGRVFFVFGPHESPLRLGGHVAEALAHEREAACTHGEQVRDFLYSEDLARAFVALLLSDVRGPVNLASGQPTRIRDLVSMLAAAAGRPDLVSFGARPSAPGEPAELTADITRLRTEVGWTPGESLERRAADTMTWWRHAVDADHRPS